MESLMSHYRVCSLSVLSALVTVGCLIAAPASAQDLKSFTANASGNIVEMVQCGPNANVCQTTVVKGVATRLGSFTGVLNEAVDPVTGAYTGEATLTFANGTLEVEYVGQVLSVVNGLVTFHENYEIVDSDGRLTGTTGTFELLGTADPTGAVNVSGQGLLVR
jgi:hypothetical protein